jgi:hypothetical protein
MPSYEETGQVSTEEIKHFDDDAKALVTLFHAARWHSYLSGNGHAAFMLAPDGKTTASVTRDSLRGRSGKNAAAKLKRWLRDESKRLADAKPKAGSFGVPTDTSGLIDLTQGGEALPVKIMVALQRHPVAGPWLERHMRRAGGAVAEFDLGKITLVTDAAKPGRWILADTSRPPMLVATSEDVTEDEAMAALRDQAPELFETNDGEQAMAEVKESTRKILEKGAVVADYWTQRSDGLYVCTLCGDRTFTTQNAVVGHLTLGHRPREYPCSECGQMFTAPAALGHHRKREHGATVSLTEEKKAAGAVTACRWCGKGFDTARGRAAHEVGVHKGEEMPTVTVTQGPKREVQVPGDVTVTSPPVTDEPAAPAPSTGDVLMDHLLDVPGGDDAEAMVAKIRALVSAPLVGEVQRLRAERDQLRADNEILSKQIEESETRMAILREALSI